MADAIDLSALPGSLKDQAIKDRNEILAAMLIDGMGFTDYMQLLTDVTDEIPLTALTMQSILQPGGKNDFNPKEFGAYSARIGKVRQMKVDLLFSHETIVGMYKSYLGKIALGNLDPFKIPFESFLIQKVVEKQKHDFRMKALYKGVYNKTGTSPEDTVDGLFKLIDDAMGTGEIPSDNVITTAPITRINAVEELEKIVDRVKETDYADVPMVMALEPAIKRHYEKDYRAQFNSSPYNTKFDKQFLDGTMIELVSEPGMRGSGRVVCTPSENLFFLVDDQARANNVEIQKDKRNIVMMLDYQCAPDFGLGELIFTNVID